MFTVETAIAEDAWREVLIEIIKKGEEIEDERELITKELLNVVVTILDPLSSNAPEGYFSSSEKVKKHEKSYIEFEGESGGSHCGQRLRQHFGFKLGRNIYTIKTDQIELIVNRLKNCETTRRATITVFDPSIDHYQNDVPSLIMIDFKIRGNRIHTTGVWRSHDIFGEWIPNFLGLKGLSKYLSETIGIKMGPITVHSISAYIYKTDYKNAAQVER